MMHGHEKSDHAIVAMKPANKVAPRCGAVRGGVSRSGVGGAKGADQGECGLAKHALDSAPGSRVTGAGTHTAIACRLDPRWEPYAGKPHVRICAGGREVTRVPTASVFLLRCICRFMAHSRRPGARYRWSAYWRATD